VNIGKPEDIAPDTVVHRVGGGAVANLRLSPIDARESPPGISVLLGGTPQEAADQMRRVFPRSRKWQAAAKTVGTTNAAAIRNAGFAIVPNSTDRFPNHARVIHANGVAGFTDQNLAVLAAAYKNTTGC